MIRFGSGWRRFTMVFFVLSLLMPLGLSSTTADGTPPAAAPLQEGQETTVIGEAGSENEQEPTAIATETATATETAAIETAPATETATATETVTATETAIAAETATTGDKNLDASAGDEQSVSIASDQATAIEVTPAQPVVTGSTCVDGVYTPPTATFGPTAGVTYENVSAYARTMFGQVVVDTYASARLADDYTWAADLGVGWQNLGNGSAEYRGTVAAGSFCEGVVVAPAQPVITGSTCVGGVYTQPSATFGPTTGVGYSEVRVHSRTNVDGQVVVVISANARLAAGYTSWASDLGAGWQLDGYGGASYASERIEGSLCGEVALAQPTITGNSCMDGRYTAPRATFGPTEHVTYRDVRLYTSDGHSYDVSALADVEPGYGVKLPLGDAWTLNSVNDPNQFFYNGDGTVQRIPCEESEVIPAQPIVTGSSCVDGTYMPPKATFGPTEHVTYENVRATSRMNAEGQVVVDTYAQARLNSGYTWPADMGNGWHNNGVWGAWYQDDVIAGSLCGEVTMAQQPTITGNTCVNGEYTPPSATFAPTEHVTYSDVWTWTEFQDGRYVVFAGATATLADGYAWASDLGEGWAPGYGPLEARYSGGGTVTWNYCGEVTLAEPVITGNTCVDDVYTIPSATFVPTEHVTYSSAGYGGGIQEGENGTFVVATGAYLDAGYVLAQDSDSGWTANPRGKGGNAFYQGVFQITDCDGATVVTPENPTVTQAARAESGEITPPSVTPATTAGIIYTMAGDVVPGGTVTITATPDEGYVLGSAAGWATQEDGTATYVVQLDDLEPSLVDEIVRIIVRIITEILAGRTA